jgi:hypothetical protein
MQLMQRRVAATPSALGLLRRRQLVRLAQQAAGATLLGSPSLVIRHTSTMVDVRLRSPLDGADPTGPSQAPVMMARCPGSASSTASRSRCTSTITNRPIPCPIRRAPRGDSDRNARCSSVICRRARSNSWRSGPICTAPSSTRTGSAQRVAAPLSRSTPSRKIRRWTSYGSRPHRCSVTID